MGFYELSSRVDLNTDHKNIQIIQWPEDVHFMD